MPPGDRDLDKLIWEKLFGQCWHDLENDDEACLSEDREEWEDMRGSPPPEDWRPILWDDEIRQRCKRCERRWRTTGSFLPPFPGRETPHYTSHADSALAALYQLTITGGWRVTLCLDPVSGTGVLLERGDIQDTDNYECVEVGLLAHGDEFINGSDDLLPLAICRAIAKVLEKSDV